MTVAYPLHVYFDHGCPLCAREMHALKRHDAHGRIELVDCSVADFQDAWAQEAGLAPVELMALIHARDASGSWLKGIAVFEAVYAAAGIDAVAGIWANPMLRPFWDWLYPHVANNRMWLSRLGITRVFGWLVNRAAKKAATRSSACASGQCTSK